MRIVFMGTPDIAAQVLSALIPKHEVVGVFCQPDKPVGRKQILTPPPVKQLALEQGIPVFQPKGFRNGKALEDLRVLRPDLIVVIAYGKILPKEVLELPPYGCLNIHGSLLPAYRGAAPVQRALMDGVKETGLTLMKMDEGMDTGAILKQLIIPIEPEDDAVSLFDKMGRLGGPFVLEGMEEWVNGTLVPTPQDDAQATLAPPIEKTEALVNFDMTADAFVGKVKGLAIWPNAEFICAGQRIKVLKASATEESGQPGEVLRLKPLTIAAKEGSVVLQQVLPQGKKPMDGISWANGKHFQVGDTLHEE